MSWFRVDDTLAAHPKTRKAGLAAIGLWTVAGSWSSQQLTEGFVPAWFVATWPGGKRLARQLVLAGLWDLAKEGDEEGWLFHDWTDANPTADQEKERRRKARDRQRRLRERSAAKREEALDKALQDDASRSTSRVTDSVSHGAPSRPYPSRPDPSSPDGEEDNSRGGASHVSSGPPTRPPLFPQHCPRHGDTAEPGPCGPCADARKAHEFRTQGQPHLTVVTDRPDWCGACDEWTRLLETPVGVMRCPECHPLAEEAS